MYRCEQCGELFHESYTEEWDIDDHCQDVDLCPNCRSEFITELPWEEAEILTKRQDREQVEFVYKLYPHRKPADYDEKTAKEIAEENEIERILREDGVWK